MCNRVGVGVDVVVKVEDVVRIEDDDDDRDVIIKMALQEARVNCSRRNP